MTINFRVKALSVEQFQDLMLLENGELTAHQAKWIQVDDESGYPCRVSLCDAKVGERVLGLPFIHHNVDSMYRASGPIFVRENALQAILDVNQVPEFLRHRFLSLRAYDKNHQMLSAKVTKGIDIELVIGEMFKEFATVYIHVHNASYGCFVCEICPVS